MQSKRMCWYLLCLSWICSWLYLNKTL